MAKAIAAVTLGLLLAAAPRLAASPDEPANPPVIREVVASGATVWDQTRILRIVRFGPGDRLWRTPEALAQALQDRYRGAGYAAAVVTGSFDESSGTLRLAVDEGRVGRVVLEGLDAGAEGPAREALGLERGKVLRERDVRDALSRLEDRSLGAIERGEDPAYRVEPGPDGAVVTLRLVQRRMRLAFVPGGGPSNPFNVIDGVAPWLGAEVTRYDAGSFRHTNAYLRGTYGLRSHDIRWAAGVRRPFGEGDRITLGYEHHDLTDSDDAHRTVMFEESPALVMSFTRTSDYFHRRGDEAYAFVGLGPRAQAGLTFRSDRHAPLLEEDPDDEALSRPPAVAGLSRSLVGTLRIAGGGPLFEGARRQRESFLLRDPYGTRLERRNTWRLDASLEWASASALGGDFDFRRLLAELKGEHVATALLRLRGRVLGGFTGGDPPPQRRMALGGVGTLRARELKELRGDHALLVNAELAIVSRKPLPGLALFYDGGAAWGDSSADLGWRSDVGLGLEWPAGRAFFVRVDGAWALDPLPGRDRFQLTGRVRLPF